MEKRNRPPASCEPCRQRKLKCNRESPCDTCVRRGKECHYSANARRGPRPASKEVQLKEKLHKLESLVSSLVSKQKVTDENRILPDYHESKIPIHGTPKSETSPLDTTSSKESPRPIVTGNGNTSYVDASHWQSVLEELREVRESICEAPSISGTGSNRSALSSLPMFSDNQPATMEELLADLPTQAVCSGLLSHFFNTPYSVLAVVHPDKFRVDYEKFWASPTEDPDFIWLALLFAILAMAIGVNQAAKGANTSLPSPKTLQKRTSQCLVMGDYTSATSNVIEALMLHMHGIFITDNSNYLQLWLALGHTIQLAFRLAYHRDPSRLPNCSIIDAEMRRRVWMNLVQIDALASFQNGLPSTIHNGTSDTVLPGNYEWSDLCLDAASLPLQRPGTHRTPTLYALSKAPIMAIFKKITQHVQSLLPTTYDRTIALDIEMRETYAKVPDLLKRRDVDKSFMDVSALLWDRYMIELLHLKSLVVLHRRYLRQELGNSKYDFSRKNCAEAALTILACQADMHRACLPGGRLYEDRWVFKAVTTTYDFILAAMVVCLDLSIRIKSSIPGARSLGPDGFATHHDDLANRELAALKVSHTIFTSEEPVFREVTVAARTLELLIKSVEESVTSSAPTILPSYGALDSASPPPAYKESAGTVSGAETHQPGSTLLAQGDFGMTATDPMWDMLYSDDPLDWPLLDQYFQGGAGGVASYPIAEDWEYTNMSIE